MEVGVIMPKWKEVASERDIGPIARTIGGAVSNFLDSAQSFGGNALKVLHPETMFFENNPIDMIPKLSEGFKKSINVTDKELEPKGLIESGAQRFLSQAPLVAAGGIGGGLRGVVSSLGRTALGSTGATVAKGLGAPEIVQDIAQIATESGVPLLKSKLTTKLNFKSPLTLHKEGLYQQARDSLAPNARGSIRSLRPALDEVSKLNQFGTDAKGKNVVNHAVESIWNNIDQSSGQLDIANGWSAIKSLGKQIKDPKTPDSARSYLIKLQDGLKSVLEDYRPHNEAFWKNRTDANAIHQVQNMTSVIGDFAKNNLSSKGSLIKKALIPLRWLGRAAGLAERAVDYMRVKPVRHFLGKSFEAAVNNNPGDLLKYGMKLDKAIDKAELPVAAPKRKWKELTSEEVAIT